MAAQHVSSIVCSVGCRLLMMALMSTAVAEEGASEAVFSVEELAARIRPSLVVIESTGRTGASRGEGSGFAIADDLIATARHVIGDGRRVSVRLPDGRSLDVRSVYAQTPHLDLAVLKTAPHGLPVLPLCETQAAAGRSVIAAGHPHGLHFTVVDGIVSGHREIDGVPMIQLSMAIEPGNSGGPVMDHTGQVIGIVTLKSAVTSRIGFAIPSRHLKDLLESPNPVSMDRWVTIGRINPLQWEILGGGRWTQRAGRILSEAAGSGFGGRTLCITRDIPDRPVEIVVDVRLEDERGAAGLVIHSDGGDRHYGFYPSAGRLRFTRFDGPDVRSWTILHDAPHPAWRSGDWNTLHVRIDEQTISCFVNGQAVFETSDTALPPGRPGLASFRGTRAQFRRFRVGRSVAPEFPGDAFRQQVNAILNGIDLQRQPVEHHVVADLSRLPNDPVRILHSQAADMERQADGLRRLADQVHAARIRHLLLKELTAGDGVQGSDVLLKSALLVARLDNPDVRVEDYVDLVGRMVDDIRSDLPPNATERRRLAAVDHWLFEKNGFRGSRQQYHARSNSYLNEVIDDREGLPITLSVLYLELTRRLNLNTQGIGLPGHFIVRFEPTEADQPAEWIDVFDRARRLTDADIEKRLRQQGWEPEPRFMEPQQPRQIIVRMLRNLLRTAEDERDDRQVLKYLEVLVRLEEDDAELRAKRLEIRARTGRAAAALEDVRWFLEHRPPGVRLEALRRLQQQLEQQASTP